MPKVTMNALQRLGKGDRLISAAQVASVFGLSEAALLELVDRHSGPVRQDFYSIGELAQRWRCSRGTVYNRLRAAGAQVLDFARPGRRGRKAVAVGVVLSIEYRWTRRLT
jgi:hypothetical protein